MTRTPTELPPYRAMLAVDIRNFSGVLGMNQAQITDAVPGILRSAFQRCGLGDTWREKRFGIGTGDGYVAGFPSDVLPLLLNPFLPALQAELDYRGEIRADPVSLRMRVSVHVGPVTDSGRELVAEGSEPLSEGSGTARIETHRHLDADPVRELLNRSGPMTRVAAIVSARAYEDAVLSGHAADPPDHYVAVPIEVKNLIGTAYLRVPTPTGELLREGFVPRGGHEKRDEPAPAGTDPGSTHSYTFHGPGSVNSGPGNQFNGGHNTYNDKRRP